MNIWIYLYEDYSLWSNNNLLVMLLTDVSNSTILKYRLL